jgi:hypothetical protein
VSLPILRESADEVRVFDPGTGEEIIIADAPTETLAELRELIRSAEEDQRMAKQALDAELLARMDRAAKWTMNEGGYKLTAPSPTPVETFDAHALRADLEAASEQGLIDQGAVDAAVEVVVDYKPRLAGINALRKLGGDLADIVARHASLAERTRRVTVKRQG